VIQGENDNQAVASETVFYPSRLALFFPALMIAIGYALLYALMALAGDPDIALARFCLIALLVAVPCLVAYAGLRVLTIRLRLLKHGLLVQQGFPAFDAVAVAYDNIDAIRVVRGFSGRISGGGTLVFDLIDGRKIATAGLARPIDVKSAIERQIASAWCGDISATAQARDVSTSATGG
jgi:hypothetical protein